MKWNSAPLARSRNSILREAGKVCGAPKYSVKFPPLATLPLLPTVPLIANLTPDVLHMRMRVPERISKEGVKRSAEFTGQKLAPAFETLVRSTQVPFKIYEATIHGKSQRTFSALTGRNWRIMLSRIGEAIRTSTGVFSEEDRLAFAFLYEEFHATLEFAGKCSRDDAEEVARRAREWTEAYVKMGLQPTPYIHIFCVHLPMSVKLHGSQDRFSGELLELNNDAIKRTHHRRTDRKNPQLTLLTQLRIELQARNAEVRSLSEENQRCRKLRQQHPWQAHGIRDFQQRKRQQEECDREEASASQQGPYDCLSIGELRSIIHQKTGKRTRKQSREGLLAILTHLDEEGTTQDYEYEGRLNMNLME